MAEHSENPVEAAKEQSENPVETVKERSSNPVESMMGKSEKLHRQDSSSSSSSSSDSDTEKEKPAAESSVKDKIYRLFGRERPVHHVLGGGKRTYLISIFLLISFTSLHSICLGPNISLL